MGSEDCEVPLDEMCIPLAPCFAFSFSTLSFLYRIVSFSRSVGLQLEFGRLVLCFFEQFSKNWDLVGV